MCLVVICVLSFVMSVALFGGRSNFAALDVSLLDGLSQLKAVVWYKYVEVELVLLQEPLHQ